MLVNELIETIERGGDEAHTAALTLGLLIEREKVRRPAGDDGGVRVMLGDELATRRLSDDELQTAVDELIEYLSRTSEPHPTAVWALTKSYDPRIVPPLIELLNKIITDPDKKHLAYQALIGIINTGPNESVVLAAVQRAAREGLGQVKETAQSYLTLH